MALVLKRIFQFYNKCYIEYNDVRLEHLPLMGSPLPVLATIGFYLYFVHSLGPKLMKNRKPMNIKNIIIAYNVFQIFWNLFVAVFGIYWTYWQDDFSLRCQPVTYDTSQRHMNIAIATYLYFISKIFDLMDTIFFVLRKKFRHITFLHTYHHTCMLSVSYVAANFLPGGHSSMVGVLNSIVHVFMYAYYCITVVAPNMKQALWWKRYLTQMQMIQFTLLFFHYLQGLYWGCNYPRTALVAGVIQSFFMFAMFSEFYYNQYIRPKKLKQLNNNNDINYKFEKNQKN